MYSSARILMWVKSIWAWYSIKNFSSTSIANDDRPVLWYNFASIFGTSAKTQFQPVVMLIISATIHRSLETVRVITSNEPDTAISCCWAIPSLATKPLTHRQWINRVYQQCTGCKDWRQDILILQFWLNSLKTHLEHLGSFSSQSFGDPTPDCAQPLVNKMSKCTLECSKKLVFVRPSDDQHSAATLLMCSNKQKNWANTEHNPIVAIQSISVQLSGI